MLNRLPERAMRLPKLGDRLIPLVAASLLTFSAGEASAQTQPVRARITETVDETNRVQLRGNVHPLARPEFDQGVVADSQPMNRMLLLLQRSPEQQAVLSALMEEQLTKSSTNYHKWLTPEEFGKQFGPADADIQAVTAWLGSHGFQGIKMGPGHMVIEFSGTAGHVRNAFHTEMHHYLVNGEAHMANASDPQIPAALAPVVAGIRSLHNFKPKSHLHPVGRFQRDKETGRVEPLLTTTKGCGPTGSQPCFALGPGDFAKIYNIPPSLDGLGQTIAVVADSNISGADFDSFRQLFGLGGFPVNVILNGPDPGLNGDEGEADLDVEWSDAVAPNATIDLVVSETTASTAGFDLSALYIVENNLAPVMSESFGVCEAQLGSSGNAFYNTLWEQAAAQGITVTVSAGDGGSDGCDDFNTATVATSGMGVSGTASTPFNVAVGGTDFDDANRQSQFWSTSNGPFFESALGYIPETTWNDSCAATATPSSLTTCVNPSDKTTLNIVSGSGGPSAVYGKPVWQQGNITPIDGVRDTPDVSLFASDGHNGSFYVVCQADAVKTPSSSCATSGTFEFLGVGGTSASAPAFAGIMALINQQTGRRQGNANVVLYKLFSQNPANCNSSTSPLSGSTCIFYDITKGNDSVPCAGKSPNCSSQTANTNGVLVDAKNVPAFTTGAGYDLATGLGSVNAGNLITAWGKFEIGLKQSVTSILSPTVPPSLNPIQHGTPVSISAKVAPNPPGPGTPSGEVSLLTDANPNPTSSSSSVLGEGAATLDGTGAATIMTSGLPGGTYNLSVHYPGDANFAPSDSLTKIPVMVMPEQSQLKIAILSFSLNTIAPPSLVYGSNYVLRAEVAGTTTPACQPILFAPPNNNTQGCATGTVTITDNAPRNGGTFALNSLGHTENQPIQLVPGNHTLLATYSGDSSYIAPASPFKAMVTVTQAGTTTVVKASPTSITSGDMVTLTATVTSTQFSGDAPGTPGGNLLATPVQFLNGTTPISGTVQLTPSPGSANGPQLTATLTTTLSALGIPDTTSPWRPKLPPGLIWLLGSCVALYGLFLWKIPRARRLRYVYGGLAVLALAAAGIAGCGGGGGGSRSTPTPQSKTVTITAKFSGDSNYTASSGATTVSVQ
jgi:Pro-kumamolisin, activation domain/Bacterial Ig-like domain (group 3)